MRWCGVLLLWALLEAACSQETMHQYGHSIAAFPSDASFPEPFTVIDTSAPEFPSGKIALVQFHVRLAQPFYLQIWRSVASSSEQRFKLVQCHILTPSSPGGFLQSLELPVKRGDRLGMTFNSSEPSVSYLVDSTVDNYILPHQPSLLPSEGDVLSATMKKGIRFSWVVRIQVGTDPEIPISKVAYSPSINHGLKDMDQFYLDQFDFTHLRKKRGASVTVVPEPSQGAQYFGSNIEERANVDSTAVFSYIDANSPLVEGVAVRIHYYNAVASKVVRLQIWRLNDDPSTTGTDFRLVHEVATSSSSVGQQQVRVNFPVEQSDVLGFTSNDATGGTLSYDSRPGYAGFMRQGVATLDNTYEFQNSGRQYAIGVVVATSTFTTAAPLVTPSPPAGGQYIGNPIRRRAKSDTANARFSYIDYAENNRLPAGQVSRLLYFSSLADVPLQLQLWRRVGSTFEFTLIFEQSSTSVSGLNAIGVNWRVQADDVLGFSNPGAAGAIDYDQDTTTYEGFQRLIVQSIPTIGDTLLFSQETTKVYSMGVHIVPDATGLPTTTPAAQEAVRITNPLTSRNVRDQQGQASYTYIDGSVSKILPTGQLKKFLLYAAVGHQSVLLQIWRPDNINIRRFRLVHQAQYTPTFVGVHEVTTDFRTLSGDRIGFTNPGEGGPIPYDSDASGYAGLQRSLQIGQRFIEGSTLLEFTEEVQKIFSFGVEVVPDVVDCTGNTGLDLVGKSVEARTGTLDIGARRTFLQLDVVMRVGVVTGYLMYVNTFNPVRVQLWRPTTQNKFVDKKFQLLHEKRVVPRQPGYLQVVLDESEYFYTKFGDLLGFTNEQDVGPLAYTFTPTNYNPQYFYTFPGVDYPIVGREYRFNDLQTPFQFSLAAYLNTNPCEVLRIPAFVTTLAPVTTRATTAAPIPGPPGPKGEQGDTGPIGPAGPQGAVGESGAKGEPGVAGLNGVDGLNGVEGAKGDKGETGADGQKGEKGEVGVPGLRGENGLNGADGINGARGADGADGVKGDKGDVGLQGLAGPPGTQGGIGIRGPPGEKGQVGDTGEKGLRGSPGPTGEAGVNGAAGVQGDKGVKGDVGEKGAIGDQGLAGDQGQTGAAGEKGAPGEVGQQGQKGDPGDAGANGSPGEDGAQGAAGDKGEPGDKGSKGEGGLGIAGPPGTMGIVGPPGVVGAAGPDGGRGAAGPPGPPGPPGQSKVYAVWGVFVGNEITGRPEVYGSDEQSRRKRQATPESGYIDIEAHHALPGGQLRAFTFYVARENLTIFGQVYRPSRNDPTTATLIAQREITPKFRGTTTFFLKEPIAVQLGDWIGFYNPNTQGIIPYEEVSGTFGYNTVLPPQPTEGDTVQLQSRLMKKYSFGAVVDADNDECSRDDHGCDQVCTNTYGSYECSCNPGYQLQADRRSCTDVNECNTNNGGCQTTCTNNEGSYRCTCSAGYLLSGDKHSCADLNECDGNGHNCSQQCMNTHGSYVCRCNQGYELLADGFTCRDINECGTNNGGCQNNCTNAEGSYTCSCTAGYFLSADRHSCTDTNECDSNNGGCSGTCQNIPGSFRCLCQSGYALGSDGTSCTDIDECATQNLCEDTCTNSVGSYTCACPAGSTLSSNGYYCQSTEDNGDNSANLDNNFCTAVDACPAGQTCVSSTTGRQCITEYSGQGSTASSQESTASLATQTMMIALLAWLAVVTVVALVLLIYVCVDRCRDEQSEEEETPASQDVVE